VAWFVVGRWGAVLDRVGRRASLRARFADARFCMYCRYDLTGNLSGRCLE